jgi:peptide/nickel transport system permease protein
MTSKSTSPTSAAPLIKGLRTFIGRSVMIQFCAGIIVLFVTVTLLAGILSPYNPATQNLSEALAPSSFAHLLGQDDLGRDVLSRLIYGGRVSLSVSVLAGSLAAIVGVGLGLVSGYYGGMLQRLIMGLTDVLLSIPSLVFSLILVAAMGAGLANLILAIGLSMVPTYIRMMNGLALSLRENDYITASRLIGQKEWRILLRHLLPNCFPTLTVLYTVNLGNAVLTESTLSYLGVGISPPTASWGRMVSDFYPYLISAPSLAISPGLCIVLIIISFNVVGDGLRDTLDPRLRGRL